MTNVFDLKNYKIINQVSGIALSHYIEQVNTTKTEVATSGFFNDIADQLGTGSVIICSVKDGVSLLAVTGNANGVVTTSALAAV